MTFPQRRWAMPHSHLHGWPARSISECALRRRRADIRADGQTDGGRVVATVRLDGGLANWRNAGADIDLTMRAADVVQALDSLGARVSATASQPQRPGEIFLKAVGTPAQGLLATASVKAARLSAATTDRLRCRPTAPTNSTVRCVCPRSTSATPWRLPGSARVARCTASRRRLAQGRIGAERDRGSALQAHDRRQQSR